MEEQAQDVVSADETENQPQEVKEFKGFKKGHPKFGGRTKKMSAKIWEAREVADRYDFNPLEQAIKLFLTGKLPASPGVKATPVSASARVKCLEVAISFLMPRLSHQSISNPEGGPVETVHLDVVELMRNPALAKAAQTLALGLSNPGYIDPFKQIEGPQEDQ